MLHATAQHSRSMVLCTQRAQQLKVDLLSTLRHLNKVHMEY